MGVQQKSIGQPCMLKNEAKVPSVLKSEATGSWPNVDMWWVGSENGLCGENLEQLLDTAEKEMKKLKSWFDANKLTLNLSKMKFIIFGNHSNSSNKKLMINDVEIKSHWNYIYLTDNQ